VTYSASVAIKDVRTKVKLLDFLGDSYRSWQAVLDNGGKSLFIGPEMIQERPSHIGFEHESQIGPEFSYNYAILRWIALRAGRQRKQFPDAAFDCPVPYYIFGGPKSLISFPVILEGYCAPQAYQEFVVDRYGLLKSDKTARELAWRNIPEGTFQRVSVTHAGQSAKDIQEALVLSGIERARIVLQFIRAEIARLDVLWNY